MDMESRTTYLLYAIQCVHCTRTIYGMNSVENATGCVILMQGKRNKDVY